jgi:hypothetical protein
MNKCLIVESPTASKPPFARKSSHAAGALKWRIEQLAACHSSPEGRLSRTSP